MYLLAKVNGSHNISPKQLRLYTDEKDLLRGLEGMKAQQIGDVDRNLDTPLEEWIDSTAYYFRVYQGTTDCNCPMTYISPAKLKEIIGV